MSVYLGIDTSNYTTSVAAYDSESGTMVSEKLLLPVGEKNCGLRQSDAVFLHVKQLADVAKTVLCGLKENPVAIGVSVSPCDSEKSYMPCFLVGKMLAEVLASAYNAKLYFFSHQRGHIAAALYSADKLDLIGSEFLALHISGGTTDLLKITPDNDKIISVECVGKSLDIKAGQAIDRVGVMLGLNFPCGAELEKLANSSGKEFKIKPCVNGLNCNLSGLQNQAQKMYDLGESAADVAKYCLDFVGETIDKMCENAREQYPGLPFVFAGGVMSNKKIKENLFNKFGGYFAEPKYSSDNAAGIAILCKYRHEK